jgi:hypothetical protein
MQVPPDYGASAGEMRDRSLVGFSERRGRTVDRRFRGRCTSGHVCV